MKVLHLSSAKSWRGGEQQIAWLFLELQKLGLKQWIACPKGSALEEWCLRQDLPTLLYPKRSSADPYPGLLIQRFCRKQQIDLLHIHDSHAHNYALFAHTWWGNKTPLVLSRRVDFPIGDRWLSRWKYRHPAIRRIICVSDFIRQLLRKDLGNSERLAVVYDGVDLSRFGFVRNGHLHRELQLPEGQLLIGNVAAIAPHKDYFTFVDTAEVLVQRQLPAHFLIIGGDGGEEQAIREYIAAKGLQERITLLGFRTDVPELLPELDLFLFSSKTEGLGSSLLDAFACRVPVVATRAGGVPELVEEGRTGLLAEPGDAEGLAAQAWRMLEEDSLRKKIQDRAFEKVQSFSCEMMARNTLAIYEQTISPK